MVNAFTQSVENNAAHVASAHLIAYSFEVTGISIDPTCTENMPAPGAEPCWDVSYQIVFTGDGHSTKALLTGILTVATGLKPPAGAILMNIVNNTNSIQPLP